MAAAKPVEITAILRDLFTGPADKVAAAASEIVKRVTPLQGALKSVDQAIGSSAANLEKAAAGVKRTGEAVTAVGAAVTKQFPNIAKGIAAVAAAGKAAGAAVAGVAGSVASAAGRAVSAITSVRTAVAGLVAGFVAGKAVGAIMETANALDDLGAASRRTGVSVETLSRLRVAAKLSNIEFTTLARSLGFLNRTLGSGTDDVRKALDTLGIPKDRVRNLKDASELLPDIADGLEKLNDQQRAAVAQSLFGRGAFEILTLLEGGSQKLRSALAEVDKFGLGVTSNQIQAADELTDAVDRLGFAWEKVKASIIEAVGPTAVSLLNALTVQISRLPDQVSNIASALEVAAGSGPNAPKARELIVTLAGAFLDFLLDGAVAIGKLIGDAFIGVLAIGISALTPAFEQLFRDSLGPVVSALPGIEIEKSKQAQLIELETAQRVSGLGKKLLDDRRRLLQDELAAAKSRAQGAQRNLDIANGFAGVSPGESDEIRRQRDAGRNFRDEVDKARSRVQDLEESLRALDRITALRSETEADTQKLLQDFATRVQLFADDLQNNGNDVGKVAQKFADALQRISLDAAALRPAPPQPAAPPPEPRAKAAAPLLSDEQRQNREQTLQQIELDRLRALGLDRQAALFEIQVQRLRAATDAEKNYGAAASDTLRQLARLSDLQAQRVNFDFDVKDITEKLTDVEKRYTEALRNRAALVEAGSTTQEAAARLNKETAATAAAEVAALQARIEQLAQTFPQFQALLKDVREDAVNLKTEIETPPKQLAGWGDQLFNLQDQIKNFVQAVSTNLADGIVGAFGAIVDGTKSVSEAFRDLAVDVLRSAAEMILKLLVLQGIVLGLKALGVPTELLGLTGGLNRGGLVGRDEKPVLGFSGGGHVPGRGPNRDTVPAVLTKGEVVQQRSAVDYYGLPFMMALNQRLIPREDLMGLGAAAAVRGSGPAFNTGGLVTSAAPVQSQQVQQAVIVADDEAMERLLAGGGGAMLRFLADNKGKY